MDRHTHIFLEYMGNMIFAHIKFTRKCIQAQIFIQMCIDIFAQSGKKTALFAFGSRWALTHIDNAVDAKQQGRDVAGNHSFVKRNIALTFFYDVD